MSKIFFILILFLIILLMLNFYKCDNFNNFYNSFNNTSNKNKIIPNKIIFNLKTPNNQWLIYSNNNFYIFPQIKYPYTFVGELDTNGLYLLKNTQNNMIMTLDYNASNTTNSNIVLKSSSQDNPNANTITNIFNPTNSNIYLDPVNKVIVSEDNSGSKIYLLNQIIGNPVEWNYNLNNATKFDIILK